MIIKEITGDLLQEFEKGNVDIIVHGCNCFHIMGAGIAGQIRWKYPIAYEMDKRTPCGDMDKLGYRSVARIGDRNSNKYIINAYTQFEPGAKFEYKAFIEVLKHLNESFKGTNYVFGFPEIGCGIGGAKWGYVKTLFNKYAPDLKIMIVHYDHGEKTVGIKATNIKTRTKR
jgi:O-acetyl-ADP-ribose deacetylase (regulator of RNase III)